jgi:hypothetical protein
LNNPAAPVVAISGTNQPQPATIATVPGVTSNYWITVGSALPNGSAKTLIASPNNVLTEFDISVNPVTSRTLATGMGSGTIGPDGCLYAGLSDTVFKLAPSSGNCEFAATNHAPALSLSPAAVLPNPAQGTSKTFTAQLSNLTAGPGQTVTFQTQGANPAVQIVPLAVDGSADFTYTGAATGTDTVRARVIVNDIPYVSNPAQITWGSGAHPSALDLNGSVRGGNTGSNVTLSARLVDLSTDPQNAIVGATVTFTLSGPACSAATGANGTVTCAASLPGVGIYTLTAHFAGDAQHLPATATASFFVTATPQIDGVFSDGFE